MTLGEMIAACLTDSGIVGQGQAASAEDAAKGKLLANMMVSQWRRKRWLVYHLLDVFVVSTGAHSYTIGPGGDFNVARPDRLEDGNFFRQINATTPNQVDYPLRLLNAREEYNRIALKSMGTWPDSIFYDSAYPLGNIFVWPVPQAGLYEIHLAIKADLPQYASYASDLALPEEYQAAIYYNLICRLRAAYRLPPDEMFVALAKEALNVLRGANTQIPTMRLPNAVVSRRWAYNVYSDGN